jgi:hypothetical protein
METTRRPFGPKGSLFTERGGTSMDFSKDLSSIVGEKWVSTDLATLGKYSRDNSFVTPRMP